MGQNNSCQSIVPDTIDVLQLEVKKHAKIFSEIGNLTYEDFLKCISELNELSRKCLDSNGNQLVFAIKKGSDSSILWKGTVRIACVKVVMEPRKIESYKLLNLKQFLQVFKTFKEHIQALANSENQRQLNLSPTHSAHNAPASMPLVSTSFVLQQIDSVTQEAETGASSSNEDNENSSVTECCICLDRKADVLLPCAHIYCYPCIEQWNYTNKTCPVCQEILLSTDETWVLTEIPEVGEVSEEICSNLMRLSKDEKK